MKTFLFAGTCNEMISASAIASSTVSLYSKKSNELLGMHHNPTLAPKPA